MINDQLEMIGFGFKTLSKIITLLLIKSEVGKGRSYPEKLP